MSKPSTANGLSRWLTRKKVRIRNGEAEIGTEPFNEVTISIEPHPEGSKRGGYVPVADDLAYYDETGNEWFPYR